MKRIFVQIASYRDPECKHTIADCLAKAAQPQRVRVGVCEQLAEEDAEFAISESEQVRVVRFSVSEAKGAGWARMEAQKLWQSEDYVLQIQAHMRFEQGWDDTLIEMLEALPTKQAVLTAWLPNYQPPSHYSLPLLGGGRGGGYNTTTHDPHPNLPPYMGKESLGYFPMAVVNRLAALDDPQFLHLSKRHIPLADVPTEPFLTAMWVGNFLFCRAEVLQQIPPDPHVYFWGEEPSYSARLWTHGYDIYHLNKTVLYHYWNRVGVKDEQIYRDQNTARNRLSLIRLNHLFGFASSVEDKNALIEIEKYALGNARSLTDYWQFIGVNWERGEIAPHARLGQFPSLGERREKIFVNIASFRDPELAATISDLFAKATHSKRIFVGVCEQKEEDMSFTLSEALAKSKGLENVKKDPSATLGIAGHIRLITVNANESKGANWARSQAQTLWNGEDYVLQIDSHMRFENGWDETLIEMLARCPSKRAIISGYLSNYEPPDERDYPINHALRMCVRKLGEGDDPQLVHLTGTFVPMDDARAGLCQTPFYIANNAFGRAEIWQEIPIDPYIYFHGDEISMSARLWTHGVDIYQPDKVVLFHYWARHGELSKHHYRNTKLAAAQASRGRVVGLLAHQPVEDYGLGSARLLSKFWQFAGIDIANKIVSKAALEGCWGASFTPATLPRIFVRIASYRDEECQHTVADLFAKAQYPDRIFVGICWQFDRERDAECFRVITRPKQVRVMPVDWRETEGVCWARAQTEMLWNGEEYTLQIDSHMRFVEGWDELMLAELAACESEKPVLSCSPAKYTPPNNLDENRLPTVRRVLPFSMDGNIRGRGEYLQIAPPKPLRGAFVAAGYMFASSEVLREVPYDPYLYFDQEEIMLAARLFTHGWDVFSARSQFIFHFYNEGNTNRPLHWNDLREVDKQRIHFLSQRGLARFNHLTGFRSSNDNDALKEIEKYGFGKQRSLVEFEIFTGIDFARKIASKRALTAAFIENITHYRNIPMVENFYGEPLLETGDMMPMFIAVDDAGNKRSLEQRAGKQSLLFFLPFAKTEYLLQFFAALSKALAQAHKPHCHLVFVVDASHEQLAAFKAEHPNLPTLWADPERKIANTVGVVHAESGEVLPSGFALSSNLQITLCCGYLPPKLLAEEMVAHITQQLQPQTAPQVLSQVAPVLIVPNVFDAKWCEKLLAAFHGGERFAGMAGAESALNYHPQAKRRTDYLVESELMLAIDDKLSRSVFPEIEKVFGFEVRYRERYKIGAYDAADGGFFNAHRDNFEPALAQRRVAMTLQLNDDYEGGGVRFPEYGDIIYRPSRGSAIVFPCANLHEALAVTKGQRFVLLGFFHGEEEEEFRVAYLKKQGKPTHSKEYRLHGRDFSAIAKARDFYRDFFGKKP